MLKNLNMGTVIVSIIISAITAQSIVLINMNILGKKLRQFQNDIIETCTSEVAKYVRDNINKN